jgi:hypothetical protein
MSKRIAAVLVFAALTVLPAGAITGGQPDGSEHPYGALILVPGQGFCSGTLIDEDVILTAGHCTDFFDTEKIKEVWVTFDPEAAVDKETWQPIEGSGTWYLAHDWATHPDYEEAAWPYTADYGVVLLDEPVVGIVPATLPEPYLVDTLLGTTGQTSQRFLDVGYGQDGVTVGGGPPVGNFDFVRKFSVQRYNPSRGAVGTQDPLWLILGNVPSPQHGSGCGGDSGSGIFLADSGSLGDTILAVHTGGFSLGYRAQICGRITSLNHRVDLPVVLDWLNQYLD